MSDGGSYFTIVQDSAKPRGNRLERGKAFEDLPAMRSNNLVVEDMVYYQSILSLDEPLTWAGSGTVGSPAQSDRSGD